MGFSTSDSIKSLLAPFSCRIHGYALRFEPQSISFVDETDTERETLGPERGKREKRELTLCSSKVCSDEDVIKVYGY